MKRARPTPHQRIMRAAERGTGLRLSAQEVWTLSRDNAIAVVAANDDEWERNPEIAAAWEQYDGAHSYEEQMKARRRLVELGESPR